jgi:hypothetical protein
MGETHLEKSSGRKSSGSNSSGELPLLLLLLLLRWQTPPSVLLGEEISLRLHNSHVTKHSSLHIGSR